MLPQFVRRQHLTVLKSLLIWGEILHSQILSFASKIGKIVLPVWLWYLTRFNMVLEIRYDVFQHLASRSILRTNEEAVTEDEEGTERSQMYFGTQYLQPNGTRISDIALFFVILYQHQTEETIARNKCITDGIFNFIKIKFIEILCDVLSTFEHQNVSFLKLNLRKTERNCQYIYGLNNKRNV